MMDAAVYSAFRLAALDIKRGVGTCVVTLKGSGTRIRGQVNDKLTDEDVLTLDDGDHPRGWVLIPWSEVAALAGVPQ